MQLFLDVIELTKWIYIVLDRTNSGGVLVNDILMHLQELSLPFGGIGPSGSGNYHGEKSFLTFTHERSTMVKDYGMESITAIRYPPYNDDKVTILNAFVYSMPPTVGGKIKFISNFCGAFLNYFFKKSPVSQNGSKL